MCDRNFIENDLQESSLTMKHKSVISVKDRNNAIQKTNKLINGYYEAFLPSYLETFELDTSNNLQSFKDYSKIKYALNEVKEYIEIFVDDTMNDLDKSIILTNVNSLIMLVGNRSDESLKQLEEVRNND